MRILVAAVALLCLASVGHVSAQPLKEALAPQPVTIGQWETAERRDAFGDPVGRSYVRAQTHFSGLYSNSAVNQRPLFAMTHFDHNGTLSLYLYPERLASGNLKRNYSESTYIVQVRDERGVDHRYTAHRFDTHVGTGGNQESESGQTLVDLFSRGERLRFLMYGKERSVERYSFTIPAERLEGFMPALMTTGYTRR